MTAYIASYDTEKPGCLAACRRIVAVHRKHQMPGTFFIVGKALEANAKEYRELLADPLFEIASHTWSHRMLRDHPLCGPTPGPDGVREEIFRGKEAIEKVFERPCTGLRPGCSFVEGLRGAPDVLSWVEEAGFQYVSSQLWGPDYSLPAPLAQPYRYDADGFPKLWEIPAHGWHENLLKDNNKWGALRLTLWPQPWPESIPTGFLKTPEDEVAINRVFIEKAVTDRLKFVSLIWHPWSLAQFDPEMRMLDQTFALVKSLGLRTTTYADFYGELSK